MPSTKKRINLTVPDALYERIQQYKEKQGILNDASACMQLISQQLQAQEQNEMMTNLLRSMPMEQVLSVTTDGIKALKKLVDTNQPKD